MKRHRTRDIKAHTRIGRSFVAVCVALLSIPSGAQEIQGGCGSLGNAFGPYDYRPDHYVLESTFRTHAGQLAIVDSNHFTPEVEALLRGKSATIGADIGYTLRAYPNHHRALLAIARLGDKAKTDKPDGSIYTIDCWFRRAITWRPDDRIVRMIYAKHLVDKGRGKEAEEHLQAAEKLGGDNPFTFLNVGLIYFDMKDYDKSLAFAHRALAMGLSNPVLREQLKGVGKWTEPIDDGAPPAATKAP